VPNDHIAASLFHTTKLVLAPLLAIVMVTLGCGRAPAGIGPATASHSSKRVQSVSSFNVGVGYNSSSNQFYMFDDFESAKQAPAASTSFLVALDSYQLFGATSSVSGTIGTVVRTPAGIELPISAGVDRFYSPDGIYDWQGELASSNHVVGAAQIADVIASASALVVEPWMAPRDAVSAATGNGNYTSGSVWGDMRLMLAAIAAWARVQPENTWTSPGGGGGGGTAASGSVETIWPAQLLAVSVDLGNLTATPITNWSTWSGQATSSLLVKLESVDFPPGSNVPIAVRVDIKRPGLDASVEVVRHDLVRLAATNWRELLTAQTTMLTDSEVQRQRDFFLGWREVDPRTPVAMELDSMLSSAPSVEARDELARILTISGFLGRGLPPQELAPDAPLGPAEQRLAGVFGLALEIASGRRIPVTNEASRSQFASSPDYVVGTLDAVEVAPDGYATAFRVLLSGFDATNSITTSIRFPLPAPRIWADPSTQPPLSDAEWQVLLSGGYEIQPGSAYRVQSPYAPLVLYAAMVVIICVLLIAWREGVAALKRSQRLTYDPKKPLEQIERGLLRPAVDPPGIGPAGFYAPHSVRFTNFEYIGVGMHPGPGEWTGYSVAGLAVGQQYALIDCTAFGAPKPGVFELALVQANGSTVSLHPGDCFQRARAILD